VKRMIFSVLVLGLMVFAGVPAEAKKPSPVINSIACLGGTVTWQPTVITSGQPLMPVAISFSKNDTDSDTIRLDVALPTTTPPNCPYNHDNLPSFVTGTDTSPITDTVLVQPTSCGKGGSLVYTFLVTCSESDAPGVIETVQVQVTSH
jgi:hypothetical protein